MRNNYQANGNVIKEKVQLHFKFQKYIVFEP